LVPAAWTERTPPRPGSPGRFDGPASVEVRLALGGDIQSTGAVWWPQYGTEEPATALEITPTAHNGIPTAAVVFSWGEFPPRDARWFEDLAQHLAVAYPSADQS
jgi:hypothetical protein